MKKSFFIIAGLFLLSIVYSACNSQADKESAAAQTASKDGTYECPMKCEGKKFEKPGQCPVCEMDLVKITEPMEEKQIDEEDSSGHEGHNH